jgi:hypothetical protein
MRTTSVLITLVLLAACASEEGRISNSAELGVVRPEATKLAISSDAWRSPVVKDVVETRPLACQFVIPKPPSGEVDPNKIQVQYFPGGEYPPINLHQVAGLADCENNAFYIADGIVFLCPDICTLVQADEKAKIEILLGNDAG